MYLLLYRMVLLIPIMQSQHYGMGMAPPLLAGQGPSPHQISTDEKPVEMPSPSAARIYIT